MIVGDFVCYSTNDRWSGLQFGFIEKINVSPKPGHRYNPETRQHDPIDQYTIRVNRTDAHRNPIFKTEWNSTIKRHEVTTIQEKSGLVQHVNHIAKFILV